MPKILKHVDLKRESPLKLIEYQPKLPKEPQKKPIKIDNPKKRFYEDKARFLLDDAVKSAREVIVKAKNEASHIISKAQDERQRIEEEASAKGYDEGYEKGLELGEKEQQTVWQTHLEEFYRLRREVSVQREQFKKHLEQECLKLSIHIAEKILGSKIEENDKCFLDLIAQGLEKAGEERNVLIRVSQGDYEKVEDTLGSTHLKGVSEVNVIKDPLLAPGDCIIEGPHFEIDAGIHTQIQNITTALRELDVILDENE